MIVTIYFFLSGLLDRVMEQNQFKFQSQQQLDEKTVKWKPKTYSIKLSDIPTFFPGRQAVILVYNEMTKQPEPAGCLVCYKQNYISIKKVKIMH